MYHFVKPQHQYIKKALMGPGGPGPGWAPLPGGPPASTASAAAGYWKTAVGPSLEVPWALLLIQVP
ncbi:hypothetical protein C4D60_Mb11t05360 [Musa balbisiana]|uniref:Uncharacterized protein n=1 Tax=Musa balbisiana TaxID=52838 RepID=A0A4S8J4C8_MUSBA|nr:hypothetical protein C4D60_Mb11t05360 [Musa balbisiana]